MEPPITPEAIARTTDLTLTQVEECIEAMRLTRCGSWDEVAIAGSRSAQSPTDGPLAEVELAEVKQVLADSIERLPYQERMVITLYYLEDLRLKEIGKVLSLSESRVSRIVANAELRLKEYIRVKTS
jgi:RNA polymerase sigma factor FliA